jgi:hypothetical protein
MKINSNIYEENNEKRKLKNKTVRIRLVSHKL